MGSLGAYFLGVFEVILHMSFAGLLCLCIGWMRSPANELKQPWPFFAWATAFSALAVINMLAPMEPMPGLRIDIRSAVILLAGMFGGPGAAVAVGSVCALVRYWIGGSFAVIGMTGVGLTTLLSMTLAIAVPFARSKAPIRWTLLAGIAAGVTGPAASIVAIDPRQGWDAFISGGPLQMAAVALSALILSQIILRIDAIRGSRARDREREAQLLAANRELEQLTASLEFSNIAYRSAQEQADNLSSQLRMMMQYAPLGMFVKATDGTMITLNEPEARIFNRSVSELAGRISYDFLAEKDARNSRESDRAVIETGAMASGEFQLDSENAPEWLLSIKFPIRNADGSIVLIGGFDLDITDRKRRELALRRTAQQLSRVQQSLKAVYWCNQYETEDMNSSVGKGRFDSSETAGLAEMTGWPAADVVGFDFYLENCVHPDDQAYIGEIYRAFRAGKIDRYTCEYRLVRRDRSVIPVKVWVEKMADQDDGRPVLLGVLQDVSEHHDKEARLAEATTRAEISERVKADFLANLSHELRTPLNAVIGFSDVLKAEFSGSDAKLFEYADFINRSGQQLLSHVNDLLDVAHEDYSQNKLAESNIKVDDAIQQALERFQDDLRDRSLVLHRQPLSSEIGLYADKKYFRRVIHNIVSNAVKFTDKGGEISVKSTLTSEGSLQITISDTGRGIPESRIASLTTPFTYDERVFSKRHGGIGIGLAVCTRIMNMHEGRIDIESAEGRGTTASLTFPAERVIRPSKIA